MVLISAMLVMGLLGAGCGLILGLASKFFYVYEDPRIEKVLECLSGANCGGCGYAGCSYCRSRALPLSIQVARIFQV